jgi:RNA polymerase-interacting CarD/CdnL/TRCF family regulator
VKLAVDDLVVYASHGVGRVTGMREQMVMLEFERGLFVTLPAARAAECVRPVSTAVELVAIGRVLGGAEVVSQENWQRRLKTTRGKVAGGEASSLAEVVRDASRREERTNAGKEPSGLSQTERQLYVDARRLLADEIGATLGVDSPSADAWIGDQLVQHPNYKPPLAKSGRATNSAAPIEVTPSGRRARRRRH